MNTDVTLPMDDPLFGNSISGLLDCALGTSLSQSAAKPWVPPTPEHLAVLLPQYRIEHLIGRGGMGAVYKGTQITLNRPVAIKILPAELARNEEFVGRFHREAQLLASLSHQSIVTIFEFGQTTEGNLYFVMEHVDGTDLHQLLQQSRMDPAQALRLTIQVCEAMQYAHDMGVIHRDIKPANVLITRDGRAKLADFGLAAKPAIPAETPLPESDDSPESPGFIRPGSCMGTPGYAAPEVYEGKADARSDIYALGIMLYEMLTGAPPQQAYAPPSTSAGVDPRIDGVVVKALEADPSARFQKASEMKLAMEAVTAPKPALPVQPRKAMTTALWCVSVLLLAGLGFTSWKMTHEPAAAMGAVPSRADPVLGHWWWPGDAYVTFAADGTFSRDTGSGGRWSCENPEEGSRRYVLNWNGGNVDRLMMKQGNGMLDGYIENPRRKPITGYRIYGPPPAGPPQAVEPGFVPLLDRDHTQGWKHGGAGTMTNVNGIFTTEAPPGIDEPWGLYWYERQAFSDFVLRVDFAVDTLNTNSGIYLRLPLLGNEKPHLHFPNAREIEILGNRTGSIPGAAQGKNIPPLKLGQWNQFEIIAVGQEYTVTLNGQLMHKFTGKGRDSGYIALQNLGSCGSAYFRSVRIKDLSVPAAAVK